MDESPESLVKPYESPDERQQQMTGESLPKAILEFCDACHWCSTCMNERGILGSCPLCGSTTSKIKINIDEICYFEDRNGNIILRFERKLPLR